MLVASAVAALGHDLYLVSGVKGADGKVCARIGEAFPLSTNGLSADRVELFRVHHQGKSAELNGRQEATQFCAPLAAGSALVEMTVRSRFINLAAKDFNAYIHGERLGEIVRLREQRGQTGAEGKEVYSRYAKLLIGDTGDLATRAVGHTLEIVPEKNPSQLKPGDSLPVRVLFRGKPLAGAAVFAVYEGAELKGHEYTIAAETDEHGRAILKLDRPGLWYARLIHMVPAEGEPDADWRSFFATVTFSIHKNGDNNASESTGTGH